MNSNWNKQTQRPITRYSIDKLMKIKEEKKYLENSGRKTTSSIISDL